MISLKNKLWILLIILIIIGLITISYFFFKNKNSKNNYTADKMSSENNSENTNENSKNNDSEESNTNNIENNAKDINENSSNQKDNVSSKNEEQIASATTKIYSTDSARQNNISITCSTLNDTIVKNGSVFSFCGTVGQSTTAKGYQEADIFDKNGKKIKGLGGGNCQISTTLYNAVLNVPNLVVIERHEHSNKVPYAKTGNDAAVAYGSYDFKFRNDTGFDIKIKSDANSNNVNVFLYKI